MRYPDTAEGFDWEAFLLDAYAEHAARPPAEMVLVRTALTRYDPLLFALTYLRSHLKDAEGRISFADPHLAWCAQAAHWAYGPPSEPMSDRTVQVAPRDTGKSTWWFLILPLWAAAHGHVKFAAAFADSSKQAETHLATFKHELDSNETLRRDFPYLVKAARRKAGSNVADNVGMYQARSGFIFAARGIDASSLGMKVNEQRPDLLILDDVEPGGSNYSAYQAEQRLRTIIDVVFPLNLLARVVLVGTVTMPDSVIHVCVKAAHGVDHPAWVEEERLKTHHFVPIVTDARGEDRSIWPQKWPLPWLVSESPKRSYRLNFMNDPMGADGDYWTVEDFRYGEVSASSRRVLSVDPAVTTRDTSDFTGVAVVSYSPSLGRCGVREARAVKLGVAELRRLCLRLIEQHAVTHLLVETNQGGDLWQSVFHDMPVPVLSVKQSEQKEVRAATCLNHYQRGRVYHEKPLPELEAQMVAFPLAPNDDMVDAVGSAVNALLRKVPPQSTKASSSSYA